MMNPLHYPVIVPVIFGVVLYLIPRKVKFIREFLSLIGSAGTFGIIIWLFINKPMEWSFNGHLLLRLDNLSGFILLASGLFGFLITLYSLRYMQGKDQLSLYYGSLLMTLGAACGVLMANHLVILLVFWGFLGITLYLLILTGGDEAAFSAKKTLIIVGGSDALILLGIVFIYAVSSTFEINNILLNFNNAVTYAAFILIALGAFAKAGAMPLHTWIPDVAESAPIPVTAYLPAALDKLLGIYLLGRMCLNMFVMSGAMNLFLMIVGAVTIIAAVMMALIQHDLRRLLAYHAVSQVGYMVLGIGTGNPIGIAGGLFHMLNHSIYKACLFLTGGSVKYRTGTTDLDKLGGLGRLMPLTYISFLIAAFAISGIPPFNGFVSKWMVYQGLLELGRNGDRLWVIWLVAAMFGSGLTLASFMKLTHSVFLGVRSPGINPKKIKEVGFSMSFSTAALALLCVIFGIFAFSIPLKYFLIPVVGEISYIGIWSPSTATVLIIIGILIGFIIYLAGNLKGIRAAESFIGGEKLPVETRVTGTGFYNTIKESAVIDKIYQWAEAKMFDIYNQGQRSFFGLADLFRKVHTGILNTYLMWVIMGLVIFIIVLMGR